MMNLGVEEARKTMNQNIGGPFGAVIVDKDDNVIAVASNTVLGSCDPTAHAEVNAINMAKDNGADIRGGTVIVSLEPCSHFGKTPPCADLIIKSGFKKVVVALVDPNPKVAGQGIEKLQKLGSGMGLEDFLA